MYFILYFAHINQLFNKYFTKLLIIRSIDLLEVSIYDIKLLIAQ